MAAGFGAIGKGIGAVGKGVGTAGKAVVKANKYTLGKAGKHIQNVANTASGYKPSLKGPAPKVETDVYGNTSLSTPKVTDPNSFAGRGGIKGALKRWITGDPQAGGEGEGDFRGNLKSTIDEQTKSKTQPAGKLKPPQDFSPDYEPVEFNPNWRNWKGRK